MISTPTHFADTTLMERRVSNKSHQEFGPGAGSAKIHGKDGEHAFQHAMLVQKQKSMANSNVHYFS